MRPELDDTAAAPGGPVAVDRTATHMPGPEPVRSPGAGLIAGQQLGHFRVERPLGAGGMGEVYLATDLALDRPVAIKVLPDALARDATRRDKLIREARAQARVVHANVGHIYFIGEERDLLFVAMEYVPGETLAQAVAKAPMPIDTALAAIRGAALGLREAHRAGFLHRDVKPSNLMFDAHGEIKVLDFGLAAGGGGAVVESADGSTSIAQTSLAGTPLYMAPEQARGEPLDVRADIYALGATLFHLVSGRPPFEANSADELRDLHSSAPRPRIPAATNPRTAIAIGELCARMMAPRPADRFASYDELIAAIDTLATSRTRPAGFWARGIATGIDLGMLGIAYSAFAALCSLMGVELLFGGTLFFSAFAAYQILCTRRWGRTAGKSLLELEVVRADTGERLSWTSATRRALAMMAVPIAIIVIDELLESIGRRNSIVSIIAGVVQALLVVHLAVASARSHGKRTLWDRLSGTLVRYRAAPPSR